MRDIASTVHLGRSIFATEKRYFAVVAYCLETLSAKFEHSQIKKWLAEMVFNFFAQICFFPLDGAPYTKYIIFCKNKLDKDSYSFA